MRDPAIPPKLRPGDAIRVIAPANSLANIAGGHIAIAAERMKSLGLSVTFGRHVRECDEFRSSPVASRVEDLHEAFEDPAVRGILTVIGGFNSNQVLRAVNWGLVARNPKVFCGFSDITALSNAILAKCGFVAYSGPHFSTFGMKTGIEYDLAHFRRCLMDDGPFEITPSPEWSADEWWLDQERRRFQPNAGPIALKAGVAEGLAVGGNLCTFNLLHGTEWMPRLDGAVVFVEEDDYVGALGPVEFDRNLQSLLHQPGATTIRGLAIGRFQPGSGMSIELLRKIVGTKPELGRVPVACGFDFGHTTPHFTFPVGGRVRLDCAGAAPRLTVVTH